MGNNKYSDVLGVESCRLDVGSLDFILTNVYYVPNMRINIISVSSLVLKVLMYVVAPKK